MLSDVLYFLFSKNDIQFNIDFQYKIKYYTCVIDGIQDKTTSYCNFYWKWLWPPPTTRQKVTNYVKTELDMMKAKLFDEGAA